MRRLRPLADQRGGASAEMALLVPLLVVLLFGGFEAGHFVWTQHKLAEAVRDGARYASRLSIGDVCPALDSDKQDDIILLTRTGQLANTTAKPKVPGWTDDQVTVEPQCDAFVDTGIYADLGDDLGPKGPVVTVSATDVLYPSLFNGLGIDVFSDIELSAKSNAPVIGL